MLNAKIMHESLTHFNQIYEVATPLELKELIPRFVEKVTWTPTEIEIALFDQEVQREQSISSNSSTGNHSGGALKVTNWLPGLDSNQQPTGYDLLTFP